MYYTNFLHESNILASQFNTIFGIL